jgi:hypothetical protein
MMYRFTLTGILASSGFVVLVPAAAGAQPVANGPEFQVNSYTTSAQFGATVAASRDGGAFVIWQSSDAQDGDRTGVFGQRLDDMGALVGNEFMVNTTTYLSQTRPDAASDQSGNFVVVWQSDLQDGDNSAVVGQRFDNTGSKVGTEFIVNNQTAGSQFNPHVGRADDGRFVVIFVDRAGLDGDSRGIFARLYDDEGDPVDDQFQVNSYTAGSQDYPDASMAPDGSFVVVWTAASDTAQDGDGQSIVGRRFDASGSPAGDEFIVNSYTTGNQLNSWVESTSDGGFVVTWEAAGDQDGDSIGVFARRFDSTGTPLGDEFQVNGFTTGLQFDGRPAPQPDGGLVITWTSRDQDGDNGGVFARSFDAAGTGSADIPVNTTTAGNQNGNAVATTGSFLVAWTSDDQDGDGDAVIARYFDVATGSTTSTTMPSGSGCGDVNGGGITATDALFILQAAIGIQTCMLCVCDVAGTGSISATDALIALNAAVGQSVPLACPPC